MINVQTIPTGQLVEQYRDIVMLLAADHTNSELATKAEFYEQEILRRMAW